MTSFFSSLRTESSNGTPLSLTNTSAPKPRRAAESASPKGPQPPCPEVMKMVVASRHSLSSSVRLKRTEGSKAFIAIISAEEPQVNSSVCS